MSSYFMKHLWQLCQIKAANLSVSFGQDSVRLSTFNVDYPPHFTLRLMDSLRE